MFAAIASGSVCWSLLNNFKELLNRIAETFPSRQALARAIGINASRLSRALNGSDKFPFNATNCLRLAKLSGEPASAVLRAAGKGEIADLIESLYGPEKPVTDTAVQDLLTHWPMFTADEKSFVRLTIATLLRSRAATQEPKKEQSRRRRGGVG
jgi:hypothetical protein